MNDKTKWYQKQITPLRGILIALLALVVILVIFLAPARAATVEKASMPFSVQAQPATERQVARALGGTCANAWQWAPSGWGVQTLSGAWWYAFTTKVIWCTDSARTKITGLALNRCIHLAGFWNFEGCTHQHQKPGFSSMNLYPQWEYYLPKTGIYRHPYMDFTIYPDGRVIGAAYSDAVVIHRYP